MQGFTVRVRPFHPEACELMSTGFVTWCRSEGGEAWDTIERTSPVSGNRTARFLGTIGAACGDRGGNGVFGANVTRVESGALVDLT